MFVAAATEEIEASMLKKLLFYKEYHEEYKPLRKILLSAQKIMLLRYFEEIEKQSDQLGGYIIKDNNGRHIIDPRAIEDYTKYVKSVQWFRKHVGLLRRLYEAHERGEDFLVEGVHYEAVFTLPEELEETNKKYVPKTTLSSKSPLGDLGVDEQKKVEKEVDEYAPAKILNLRPNMNRAMAEEILGVPLLYGRIYLRGDKIKERARSAGPENPHRWATERAIERYVVLPPPPSTLPEISTDFEDDFLKPTEEDLEVRK